MFDFAVEIELLVTQSCLVRLSVEFDGNEVLHHIAITVRTDHADALSFTVPLLRQFQGFLLLLGRQLVRVELARSHRVSNARSKHILCVQRTMQAFQ